MDLHLHTPASADWQEPGVTYLEWLQKAESRGLDIVAITDHNTVEGIAKLRAEIERLAWLEANDRLRPQERRELDEYRRIGDKLLVLPGFEFTAMFGFHILGIFPPETSLRKLELLLLRLNVPDSRLTEGSTEVGASTDVLAAYRLINEAGGMVIAAHANSTHGVALQGLSFGGQTKIAFTQDPNLHALEVTDLESVSRRATARFFDGSKPEYPRRMHCIQGSDAHRLNRDPKDKNRLGVGERVTEVLLPDISFEALKAVLEADDFARTRPYRLPAEVPFDHIEAAREQGNTIIQAFHESLSREGGRLHKVLCDVVAFANTNGGTVYVGASATRKTPPKGVENADQTAVLLRREIERNVNPPLDVRVDSVQSLGVPMLRAMVPSGPDKPYALNQTRIYVRQEGETNEAMRDELVQLVLGGQPAPVQAAVPVQAAPAEAAAAAESPAAPVPAKHKPAVAHEVQKEPAAPSAAPQAAAVAEAPEPGEAHAASAVASSALPSIGVEIVGMEERKGARYFTIRDLRNGNTVQNVTIQSARKLWSYAISQHLTNPVDVARVEWRGDIGLWQSARRAKALRYDLVLRQPDGSVRAFYGVTGDGMTGPWAQFLKAEDREGVGASFDPGEGALELAAEWDAVLHADDDWEPILPAPPALTEAALGAAAPGAVAEPVPQPAAKPARRSSSRPRTKKAAPAPQVDEPAAESVKADAAPAQAEVKPKQAARRARAKVQPEAAAPAAPAQAEAKPKAAAAPAQAEAKPKQAASRSRAKARPDAAAPAAPAIVAPEPEAAPAPVEAKPAARSRSRARKPKAETPAA